MLCDYFFSFPFVSLIFFSSSLSEVWQDIVWSDMRIWFYIHTLHGPPKMYMSCFAWKNDWLIVYQFFHVNVVVSAGSSRADTFAYMVEFHQMKFKTKINGNKKMKWNERHLSDWWLYRR